MMLPKLIGHMTKVREFIPTSIRPVTSQPPLGQMTKTSSFISTSTRTLTIKLGKIVDHL